LARQNLGARPSRPNDVVDIEWAQSTYPSYSSFVSATADFTLTLLSDPINHTMLLCEMYANGADVVVTVPGTVKFTVSTAPVVTVPSGKTAFFGLRYSTNASAWFLLSSAVQA
jgi:hypothetical protein